MTLQEFKNLPSTRKGLILLDAEFKKTNDIFFNEVARELRTHLQLPTAVKKVVGKFNFEKHYELKSKFGKTKLPF